MNGQWIGSFDGTRSGDVIINIDDRGSYFQGVAYLKYSESTIPTTCAAFKTIGKDLMFAFRTQDLWAVHPQAGNVITPEEVQKLYPDLVPASYADVKGTWNDRSLSMEWRTDTGDFGSCTLPKSRAIQPSTLKPLEMSWAKFKIQVASLAGSRHLFRGQGERWRLRTGFHRTGRADLVRFVSEDIQVLHRHLSVRTKHIFNLANSYENGAFFNLVQHHGYPTPLLDWTFSPYVAAFFAYRKIPKSEEAGDRNRRVRVFMLDERWRADIQQVSMLDRPFPHFSIAEFIAIENERLVPQQSISAITNLDDIETYIQEIEATRGTSYLTAIDLPAEERQDVFRELAYMGVTAGSLFPGLDGACEELKERNFR
jgi:hypothetical protein